MRASILATLIVLLLLVAFGAYSAWRRGDIVFKELDAARAALFAVTESSKTLHAELEYLMDSRNLEKELKSRFNFKRAGEKLIILVPQETTSTPQATSSPNP